AALMRHVAGCVDVDQRSDARDHEQHDCSEAVNREVESDAQVAALKPGEITLDVSGLQGTERQKRFHYPPERQQHRADGDSGDKRVRPPASEDAVYEKSKQRKCRYEPEMLHRVSSSSNSRRPHPGYCDSCIRSE